MTAQLKVSNFYGAGVARPYLVFDAEGKEVKGRVDQPRVNEALIAWGSKVPFEAGGLLARPNAWRGQEPGKARTEFAIFEEERRGDILAAHPGLLSEGGAQEFRLAATEFWHSALSADERQAFKERAVSERAAAREAGAALAEADPSYAKHVAAAAIYKSARGAMASAARAAAGPLWRAQRSVDAKARADAAAEAEARRAAKRGGGGGAAGTKKPRGRAPKSSLRPITWKRPSKKMALAAARAAAAAEAEADDDAVEALQGLARAGCMRTRRRAAGAEPVYDSVDDESEVEDDEDDEGEEPADAAPPPAAARGASTRARQHAPAVPPAPKRTRRK